LARLYRRARVGIVTPFADGMNLVAKEYVAAQDPEDPGVLILSHMAGAAEDLTDAIQVNPYDIEDMSEALKTALALPLEERKRRHASCMAQVRATDVNRWSQNFVEALQACLPTLVTKPAAREWTDA
jgi:trehalose 6-phosphate synthase